MEPVTWNGPCENNEDCDDAYSESEMAKDSARGQIEGALAWETWINAELAKLPGCAATHGVTNSTAFLENKSQAAGARNTGDGYQSTAWGHQYNGDDDHYQGNDACNNSECPTAQGFWADSLTDYAQVATPASDAKDYYKVAIDKCYAAREFLVNECTDPQCCGLHDSPPDGYEE